MQENNPTGYCDSWRMGASIVENLAEMSDPIIGVTAVAKIGNLYLNDMMDGKISSACKVAKAKMESDIDGALFTAGSIGGLACAIAEPCGVGAMIVSFIVGYGADTVIQTEFADGFQKVADKFYEAHPVVDPKPTVTPRQNGPARESGPGINTITIKAQSMIAQRGNPGSFTMASVKKTSSLRTYTHTSTHSQSSWKQTYSGYNSYTQSNYSYTSSVYHYTGGNSIYTFSASNGYYQKNIGGIRMS